MNQVLGFAESFRSTGYCRLCVCTNEECQFLYREDVSKLRTIENYALDSLRNGKCATGIAVPSALSEIIIFVL